MWTYLFGPILAIFPNSWRKALPFSDAIQWGRATAISGLLEAALGLAALMQWYSTAMTAWVSNGTAVALSGKMGPEVRVQDIGGAALFVWATHPLTWLLAYVALEGTLRFCTGAFGRNSCGVLPLYIVDKIVLSPFRRSQNMPSDAGSRQGNVASFAGAIRERYQAATLSDVPDELHFDQDAAGDTLDVYASRRKQDWVPPRIVRYSGCFYRLEGDSSASGARPFRYRLRRLAAGVASRSVILYSPEDAVIRGQAVQESGSRIS